MSSLKTRSSTRRRSSGHNSRILGAVKLQGPVDSAGEASGIREASPARALPAPASMSSGGGAEPVAGLDAEPSSHVEHFTKQLASSGNSDRWLDERIAAVEEPTSTRSGLRTSQASNTQKPNRSASSQIVRMALQCITDQGSLHPAVDATKKTGLHAQSLLDKVLGQGEDAINGLGKLMEGFAVSLDVAIGQAFGDWAGLQFNVDKLRRGRGSLAGLGKAGLRTSAALPDKENSGMNAAASSQPSGRQSQPRITSFMNKLDIASAEDVQEWRKRAQQLALELQRVQAQQQEYQRLRQQYDKLQQELQHTSSQADKLAKENCHLKLRGTPSGVDAHLSDPLAVQQVTQQMEALLSEKSRLVQENDRLLRENTGLQELLEFTVIHHAQMAGDGELFGSDEEDGESVASGRAAEGSHADVSSVGVTAAGPGCDIR